MNRELKSFQNIDIKENLQENIEYFNKVFEKDAVFRMRKIKAQKNEKIDCIIMFLDGMVDSKIINESIVEPLLEANVENNCENLVCFVEQQVLFANEIKKTKNVYDILSGILYGDTALIIDGSSEALIINTKGWRSRGISEPDDERVLLGPREGFDEALMLNLAMLRRKLPTPDLCVEMLNCGRKTDTKIFICYIDSLVKEKQVIKIKEKISKIDIDGILDSNYIDELINKNKISIYKTMGTTERPDIVAARLLEGRIAIMVDGTPVVLTVPYLYCENFQADDDYYQNFLVAAIGRTLRYISYYISICLPALYIALSVFNPQLLPTNFLRTISEARVNIPFSTFGESLVLILIFEILKEVGIRMPQSVGHAMSIVGGLVVGQAAVEANIVSAPILIITAFSGITGLMVPRLKGANFYCKLILLCFSATLGMFGFFVGITLLQIHLYSLNSLDANYTAPGYKFKKSTLKDTFIRVDWNLMLTRPKELTANLRRLRKR